MMKIPLVSKYPELVDVLNFHYRKQRLSCSSTSADEGLHIDDKDNQKQIERGSDWF